MGQLVQVRRALRPDGLLLCVSFGGQTLAELRTALERLGEGMIRRLKTR